VDFTQKKGINHIHNNIPQLKPTNQTSLLSAVAQLYSWRHAVWDTSTIYFHHTWWVLFIQA